MQGSALEIEITMMINPDVQWFFGGVVSRDGLGLGRIEGYHDAVRNPCALRADAMLDIFLCGVV